MNEPVRITFEVDFELKKELMSLIPYGTLRPLFTKFTKDLIKDLKKDPGKVLGDIVTDKVEFKDPIDGDK